MFTFPLYRLMCFTVILYFFNKESDFGMDDDGGNDSDYSSSRKSRKSRSSQKHSSTPQENSGKLFSLFLKHQSKN